MLDAIDLPAALAPDRDGLHFARRVAAPWEPMMGAHGEADLYPPRARCRKALAGMPATRRRLERLRGAVEALELIGLPAALLDGTGAVLAANALMKAQTAHVIWLADRRLALADRLAGAGLSQAFANPEKLGTGGPRSFPSRPPASGEVRVVHLIPITGPGRESFDTAFAILALTPVPGSTAADPALIRDLFNLTPAEARVACQVGKGLGPVEIAAEHGISAETVRAQLKSAFVKTGTGRQSEVAALVAGVARLPFG